MMHILDRQISSFSNKNQDQFQDQKLCKGSQKHDADCIIAKHTDEGGKREKYLKNLICCTELSGIQMLKNHL